MAVIEILLIWEKVGGKGEVWVGGLLVSGGDGECFGDKISIDYRNRRVWFNFMPALTVLSDDYLMQGYLFI